MIRARITSAVAMGLLAAAALPTAAEAGCFYVYNPKNELVYRSTLSPVDLSQPISAGMRGRYAGGHLTMVPSSDDCIDLAAYGPSQEMIAANAASGRNLSPIEASPLFRNIETRSALGDTYAAPPSARGAGARSGR